MSNTIPETDSQDKKETVVLHLEGKSLIIILK